MPLIVGFCIALVSVVILIMCIGNEATVRNNLEAAIQEDVLENFSIQEISVKYGTSEFLNLNTEEPGDDEKPVVFVGVFHHEDGAVTEHEMLYHVEHDLMVPLQHEAAEVQHVLQPGSKLDTLLQEHSAHL